MDRSSSDEALVSKIVESNDTFLFAILYDRYSNKVYNKCLGFVKNTEEAQDLTHDIFVQLFVKLRTFKGRSKFSTWLYSFTYNFCVNYVQRQLKKRKEKEVLTDDIQNYSNRHDEEVDDSEIYKMKADKLAKALDRIDVAEKMLLFMKYQDGMSIKEIMSVLEIGESAVKMRLNRAKSKLLEIYKRL
ncbi:RNA polymerase subunit sigma-70 [Sediminicola luteus]|uniref:RNA polymerase subunit sigma-70 n=1 Tax=Sediminicola luteus TaxID=319238 RepID=A0A2A4GBB0_9FLAO|nr:RNA polymerase subunit sigma-70 [Sediminicola luteus]